MTIELFIHVEPILVRQLVPLCLAFQLLVIVKNFLPVRLGLADGAQFCSRSIFTMACPAVFSEKILSLAGIPLAFCCQDDTDGNQ